MHRGMSRLSAWVVVLSMVLPTVVGCGQGADVGVLHDTDREQVRGREQAATAAPPGLPPVTYVPPAPVDIEPALAEGFAPLAPSGFESAGSIPANSSVSADGAFHYSIPLRVPAGRNGLTPALSLTYNSRGAQSGSLGVGFALGGLSKIERCAKVLAVEETAQNVQFTEGHQQDSYCLDGKKLMVITGLPGEVGSTYRTEVADYSEIILNGSKQFVIRGADGLKRTFIPQNDLTREVYREGGALPPTSTKALRWYLSQIADHYGNVIDISYTYLTPIGTDGTKAELTPEFISYSGRRVRLVYEGGAGSTERCVSGVCVAAAPLLNKIEVEVQGDPAWEYRLDYQNSWETGRARLRSVEWCGPAGECLPKTMFNWASDERSSDLRWRRVWSSEPIQLNSGYPPAAFLADLDGDGRDDVIYSGQRPDVQECLNSLNSGVADQRVWFRRSQGMWLDPSSGNLSGDFGSASEIGGFFREVSGSNNLIFRLSRFADFDNDGAEELVAYNAINQAYGGYRHVAWDATSQKLVKVAGSPLNLGLGYRRLDFADVDGNGLVDVLHSESVSDNTATGPATSVRLNKSPYAKSWMFDPLLPLSPPYNIVDRGCSAEAYAIDSDGDGKHAMNCRLLHYSLDDEVDGQSPALSDGPGRQVGDVNGDGLSDVIYVDPSRIQVRLNTGNGFRPPYDAFSGDLPGGLVLNNAVTGDFNGDGRIDLFVQGEAEQGAPGGCSSLSDTHTPAIMISNGRDFLVWRPDDGDMFPHNIATGPDARVMRNRSDDPVPTFQATAIGDVDGNGRSEILFLNRDGDTFRFDLYGLTGMTGSLDWQYAMPEVGADLLVRVYNEYSGPNADGVEKVNYASIARADEVTGTSVYTPGTSCVWPQKCLRRGLTVVESYRGSASSFRTWQYRYDDARSDLGGRGFLGFKCVTRIEKESKEVVQTCYDNVTRQNKACPGYIYPFAQLPQWTETRTPILSNLSRVRGSRTVFGYRDPRWMASAVYTVEKASQTTWTYEGVPTNTNLTVGLGNILPVSTQVSRVLESFVQDDKGNETQYHRVVEALGETENTDIFRNFQNNVTDFYKIGLLTHEEVQKQRTNVSMRKHVRDFTYDRGALKDTIIEPQGNADLKKTVTLSRDATGNVSSSSVKIAGPSGPLIAETKYEYDADGVHLYRVTNPLGHQAYVGVHPALGVPLITRSANGVTRQMRYDFAGRIRSVDGPDEDDITFQYGRRQYAEARGFPTTVSQGIYVFAERSEDDYAAVGYDTRGRTRETFERNSISIGSTTKTQTFYDPALGFVSATTLPFDVVAPGAPPQIQYEHDLLGRPLLVTQPDGSAESWQYPTPFETRHVDADGRIQVVRGDVAGLTKEVANVNGTTEAKVSYRYYPFGEAREIEFASGSKIKYEIDDLGRPTKVTDPDAGVSLLAYNALGLVRQRKTGGNPNDNQNLVYTTDQTFDLLGRLTHANTKCLATATDCRPETRNFIYDAMPNAAGKLVRAESVTDGITTTFKYDSLSRPSSVETFVDGDTYTVSSSYDSRQRLSLLTYPGASSGGAPFSVDYTYDSIGDLFAVESSSGTLWVIRDREADGRVTHVQQRYGEVGGALFNRHFEYDVQTRNLMNQDIQRDDEVIEAKEYFYYPSGLLQRTKSHLATGGSASLQDDESYTYDYAARLASWTSNSGSTQYSFNADGSITGTAQYSTAGSLVNRFLYTYGQTNNAGPHAPTAFGSTTGLTFNYDKSGRLTQKLEGTRAVLAAKYTDQNLPYQVTQVASSGVQTTTTFRYDAFGNRVVKSAPGFQSLTIGKGYERQKVTTNNVTKTTHAYRVFAGDQIIAQETYEEGGPVERTFINTDRLGSSSLVVRSDGTIKQALKYDPWGKRLGTQPNPKTPYRIGYTGHEHDDDLGLINMGGRIYDPDLRIVLTPDPMASAATNEGIHPYLYTMGNPVNGTDPSGFMYCESENGHRVCGPDLLVEGMPGSDGGGAAGGGTSGPGGGAGGSAGSGTSDQAPTNPTGSSEANPPSLPDAPGSAGGAGSGNAGAAGSSAAAAAAAAAGGHGSGMVGGGTGEGGGGASVTGGLGIPNSTGVSDGKRTTATGLSVAQGVHIGLAVASMAPGGVGVLFAVADAALYVYEGDYTTAATQVAIGLAAVVGTGALVWAGGRAWGAFKAWNAARGAAGFGQTLSKLAGKDAEIFAAASKAAASKGGSFLDDLGALSHTVGAKIPGGQVHMIGSLNGQPVFGSLVSRTGIVSTANGTQVVKVPLQGAIEILGPFR
jgi:RHS repeat-associated protein